MWWKGSFSLVIDMGIEVFENYECDGQMEITDYINKKLINVKEDDGRESHERDNRKDSNNGD